MVLSIILILWNLFGESPTETIAIMAAIFTVLIRVGSVEKGLVKLETRFDFFERDFKELCKNFKEHSGHSK
ncbi:hypothetical protein HYX16_04895 [Candidatus Woesearchaeota archaeon]|nr:hypothetical protein [Candidatus Woesearchaeota archaeon]